MAITSTTIDKFNNFSAEATGIESGSEHVFAVRLDAKKVVVEIIPTSAGTATVQTSLANTDADEVTSLSEFIDTAVGAVSDATAQELPGGVKLVAIAPASGTWTARLSVSV